MLTKKTKKEGRQCIKRGDRCGITYSMSTGKSIDLDNKEKRGWGE
jgi:hypothetical protein